MTNCNFGVTLPTAHGYATLPLTPELAPRPPSIRLQATQVELTELSEKAVLTTGTTVAGSATPLSWTLASEGHLRLVWFWWRCSGFHWR